MVQKNKTRYHEIDGIRGWAALSVVCFHLFWEVFGRSFEVLHSPALFFLLDGALAVYIFFVLSGDALSVSFFKNKNTDYTIQLVINRYFRLAFPVLLSTILVYCILKFNLNFAKEAATLGQGHEWLGICGAVSGDFMEHLNFAFFNMFFKPESVFNFNPFLWTMSIELLGSLIVFLNIFVADKVKKPLVFLLIQFALFSWMQSFYGLFIFGMILGYLRGMEVFEKIKSNTFSLYISYLIIALVIYYDTTNAEGLSFNSFDENYYMGLILVTAIYSNRHMVYLFSTRVSRFLGEISFPIYIIHFGVIISFTSYLIIKASTDSWFIWPNVLLIPIFSVLLSILIATGFREIEKIFLKKMNWAVKKSLK